MPVKPLSFKGDKKPAKKRKHHEVANVADILPTKYAPTGAVSVTADEDDSWIDPEQPSDITGPVLIVLPTSPPTCLASDANGRVFASRLENTVDNDPRTAEPHDVRQVWVAQRVAGVGTSNLGFKGAHGGWLSCDSAGVLGATREARGVEEDFVVERLDDLNSASQHGNTDNAGQPQSSDLGRWGLQTAASGKDAGTQGLRYLYAVTEAQPADKHSLIMGPDDQAEDVHSAPQPKHVSITLRGNGEPSVLGTPSIKLIIRMQARFLPRSASAVAAQKAREKVSRKELEAAVGRKLEDHEVKKLKRARREGVYHEEILDMRAKGRHDKYA